MARDEQHSPLQAPAGYSPAPIHPFHASNPLNICIFVRTDSDAAGNPFILLRALPWARVYLGVLCDAAGRMHGWLELWVQTLELRDFTFSGYEERLPNPVFDQRWRAEMNLRRAGRPGDVIAMGMEECPPAPVVIRRAKSGGRSPFLPVEVAPWKVCQDDATLEKVDLPPYTTSSFRYLFRTGDKGEVAFLATAPDARVTAQVEPMSRLSTGPDILAVFNPAGGFVAATRFMPLEYEDFLQVLEGRAWQGTGLDSGRVHSGGIYGRLEEWSKDPRGLPFLLHARGTGSERLSEIFYLKLALFRDALVETRAYVKSQQLPLLNLSPASFRVALADVGDQFPALWAAKGRLVKPGIAYPLRIKGTEQRYFVRLGRIDPSPFFPEGMGAHSFGIGSVRLRSVEPEQGGIVLDGTLLAEDYLRLDPHDLLWFRLPLAEEPLEFYAHTYKGPVGPRETRFRTVPMKLSEGLMAALKRLAGTPFPKSPYEIWPLLSSPCDLFSLGVMGVRMLLANSQSNLPVILDEVLSLATQLGAGSGAANNELLSELRTLTERDTRIRDLVSPQSLVEGGITPEQARSQIHWDLWIETVALLLRFFPQLGEHGFCKSFGDVSAQALETVFDRPMLALEEVVERLRSTLVPSLSANEEIVEVLLRQLGMVTAAVENR
ncbi:MAG: hypothetical protein U1G07_16830 [Verrucomicrobiota bacterium]